MMAVRIRSIKEVQDRLVAESGQAGRWRWYHGLAFYLIVQVLTFGLSGLVSVATGQRGKSARETFFGDVSYFKGLKQAKIAPPSWAFGPAWTINNLSTIWGTLRVLNKPEGTPGRGAFLALQGITWVEFVSFNAAYFSLRSPINALVLTATFFILTIISELIAIFQLKDTRVALSLGTLLVWLVIATTAATAQVLWNEDELYGVGPFVEPSVALVKESVQ
jgi:tryptophan-rich sensory protein